jgi:hypothetical protein
VQLVKTLSEVNLQPGELTPEKADKWKQNLERLTEQGIAALPVLREFFQRNDDVRFDSRSAGLLGEPTLRIAFLKVLSDIPNPDNVDLEEQILRSTADPDEIVLLDRQLEMQEPGKYRELVIEASKLALQKARDGGLTSRDTAPLVKLLERYGVTAVK